MRLSIIIFSMIISSPTIAQLNKGDIQIGGVNDLNFMFGEQNERNSPYPGSSIDKKTRLAFFLDSHIGYGLNSKWLLGAKIGYGYEYLKFINSPTHTYMIYLGPFVKRYFALKEDLFLFANIGIGWGINNVKWH